MRDLIYEQANNRHGGQAAAGALIEAGDAGGRFREGAEGRSGAFLFFMRLCANDAA